MQLWNQLNFTTKIVLAVLALVSAVFLILVLFRTGRETGFVSVISVNGSQIKPGEMMVPTPNSNSPSVIIMEDSQIWSNPGVTNSLLGSMKSGESAELIGKSPDGEWYVIRIASMDYGQGWISSGSGQAEMVDAVPVVETSGILTQGAEPPEGVAVIVANQNADIYSSSNNQEKIGLLLSGTYAELLGKDPTGQWWIISVPYVDDGRGWVRVGSVTAVNSENIAILGVQTAEQIPPDEQATATAISNVNIRSGPDLVYPKIGLLRAGDVAPVVGVSPDRLWWAIEVSFAEDGKGWVATDYVSAQNTSRVPIIDAPELNSEPQIPSPAPGAPTAIATTRLNIRSGPDTGYELVGRLDDGQKSEIVGRTGDSLWWAINLPSAPNGVGWISALFVDATNADEVPVLF